MAGAKKNWKKDCCEVALKLSKLGYAVIPVSPYGKPPCFNLLPWKDDRSGHTDKPLIDEPANAQEIRQWFKRNPDINIGVGVGSKARLLVLDFDGPVPPDLELPDTPTVKTVRDGGGYHYYFRYPESQLLSLENVYQWSDGSIKYMVEVRLMGEYGYSVCPPSQILIKEDGEIRRYEWVRGRSLLDVEPVEFPAHVVNYLRSKSPSKASAKKTKEFEAKRQNVADDLPWFEEAARDEEVAIRILDNCGVQVSAIGRSFLCPLHEERNPSAALWRDNRDVIKLHDFHYQARGGEMWYSLPHVYAAWFTGKSDNKQPRYRESNWDELWWARALYECGCSPFNLPTLGSRRTLPEHTPKSVRDFYEGLCYALQLKRMLFSFRSPTKLDAYVDFPGDFYVWWCQASKQTWPKSREWLTDKGFIKEVTLEDIQAVGRLRAYSKKTTRKYSGRVGAYFTLRDPDQP